MENNLIEVFITYTDNFPAGTFYLPKNEIRQLLTELEDTDLDSFSVNDSIFLKEEIRGIRINGNIGIELPYDTNNTKDSDFKLLNLMDLIDQ